MFFRRQSHKLLAVGWHFQARLGHGSVDAVDAMALQEPVSSSCHQCCDPLTKSTSGLWQIEQLLRLLFFSCP